MTVHVLRTAPPPELAQALEQFEEQFRYPLGPGRFFPDQPRGGLSAVLPQPWGKGPAWWPRGTDGSWGSCGRSPWRLALPGGGERPVLYVGDAKIDPGARGRQDAPPAGRGRAAVGGSGTEAAFAVVMGMALLRFFTRYTGRLGILRFAELGEIRSCDGPLWASWLSPLTAGRRPRSGAVPVTCT